MRQLIIPVILFFALTQTLIAQDLKAGWEKWQYMMGAWEGEGSGRPDSGSGSYTLKPKLGGCILERKGVTDIPAAGGLVYFPFIARNRFTKLIRAGALAEL